jgi:hypothetical protein
MVYDTGYRAEPFPHRCGAILEFCILDDSYTLYFCSVCRIVIGFEKDGMKYMKADIATGFKQKQYSDKTIKESQ